MKKFNLILSLVIIIVAATTVVAVGTIINVLNTLRLPALRWMFIAIFKIIRIADKLTFGKIKAIHALYWPTMWLSHYLNGSGKTLVVPTEVMEQAAPLFVNRCGYLIDSYNGTNTVGLHHSTLYEGSGFHGRPSLFYLVGGFTYKVEAVTKGIRVYGEDLYDGHYSGDHLHYSDDKALEAQRLEERYWDAEGPAFFYDQFHEMDEDQFELPEDYLWKYFFMQMHKEIQSSKYYWNFDLWLKERWPHYEAYIY